jgi:O-antigen/teichoic acid export membrane protein
VTVGSLAMVLGGPATMARFVPTAPPDARQALARRLGLRLAAGRGVQVLAVAGVATVAALVDGDRFPPLATAVVVAALGLNVLASVGLQVGLGLGRAAPWSARYPLQNAILVAAVLVLHPLAGDAGALVAILVAGAAAAVLGCAVAWPVVATPGADVALPAGALRFGQLQAAGAALTQLAQRGGVLAVAVLAGSDTEAGSTSLALGIALGVTYAVVQLSTVAVPHLVGDRPAGDAEAVLQRLCATTLAVLLPAGVVVAALLPRLVPAVFGRGYDGAVAAFGPAVALVVLAPVHALAVQAAVVRLRPRASLAAGGAAAAAFVACSLATIPAWGAPGGTAAALAAVAAHAAVSIRLLPGAVPTRLAAASAAGATGVLVLALAT